MARDIEKYKNRLDESHWFSGLPEGLKSSVISHAKCLTLNSGEFLFRRGDASDGLYAVIDGAINVGVVDPHGKEALLVVAEPVMWFGEICLVDDLPRTHDAVAALSTTLLKLDQHVFREILNKQPEYWRYIALLLSQKLRLVLLDVEAFTLFPAAQRLAQRLIHIAGGYGNRGIPQPRIKISQERLALMLALSRQTTNHLLKAFEEKGVIRVGFGEIEILDFNQLQQHAYQVSIIKNED